MCALSMLYTDENTMGSHELNENKRVVVMHVIDSQISDCSFRLVILVPTPTSPTPSLEEHNIYVQAINPPTVPAGEEKLRVAPTPFHTPAMMDEFVQAVSQAWTKNGLHFNEPVCPKECEFCKNPEKFEELSAREREFAQCGMHKIPAATCSQG